MQRRIVARWSVATLRPVGGPGGDLLSQCLNVSRQCGLRGGQLPPRIRHGIGIAPLGCEGFGQIDQRAQRLLERRQWLVGRLAFRDGLREVVFYQFEEPLRLPTIEPHDGGDILLLLRAEVENGARDLAINVARIERQHLVAPGFIALLRAV